MSEVGLRKISAKSYVESTGNELCSGIKREMRGKEIKKKKCRFYCISDEKVSGLKIPEKLYFCLLDFCLPFP